MLNQRWRVIFALTVAAAGVTAAARAAAGPQATHACPGAETIPRARHLAEARAATLCLVNEQRASAGVAPLRDNSALDRAASAHARDMVRHDYFDHTGPGALTLERRLQTTGYFARITEYDVAENLGEATGADSTPAGTVASWMESPPHRQLLLSPDFRDTGIGIAPGVPSSFADGTPGATYTQDFGWRSRSRGR